MLHLLRVRIEVVSLDRPFDAELKERRTEIERLFRRITRFCRVFTRYDRTDLVFSAFVTLGAEIVTSRHATTRVHHVL